MSGTGLSRIPVLCWFTLEGFHRCAVKYNAIQHYYGLSDFCIESMKVITHDCEPNRLFCTVEFLVK